MISLEAYADRKLGDLEAAHLRRRLRPAARIASGRMVRDGRTLVSFSCNDYLGLSQDPRIKAAAIAAVEAFGAGAGASRLVTGDHPLLCELEARLAAWKGTEAACVFGSGYLANVGTVPTFVGPDDLVLIDELGHACLFAGAQLSRARLIVFRHNDVDDVAAKLATHRAAHPRALVLTDGVFSMDGDLAPLDRLSELCARHGAWLMSDDAHGVGVLADGRGSAAMFPTAAIPLQMGTLSKAIGSYGGYVCASRSVVELLRNRARSFVYSTGLPPAAAGAAIAALDLMAADPELCARPLAKARRFTRRLSLPDAESPIVPVVLGSAERALAASAALEAEGFLVAAIRPPTVPPGSARLRVTFSAGHDDETVDRLADAVRSLLES